MRFVVLSRQHAEKQVFSVPYIMISITDPESQSAILPVDNNRLDELRLKFHDIDLIHYKEVDPKGYKKNIKKIEERFVLFSEEHAKKILEFVELYKNDIKQIVCHCEAGISRSAGVACALANILDREEEKWLIKVKPLYNRKVYSTILNRYYVKS